MVSAGAELMFGAGLRRADFLYAYIGYYLGGGLVLDHHLFPGRNKLAGAIGDIPMPAAGRHQDRTIPLMQNASLRSLASRLGGDDRARVSSSTEDWGDFGGPLIEWIDAASEGLAYAARSAVALLDIDNVVIDGAVPAQVRKEIAKATRRKLARSLVDRPESFSVIEGSFGHLGPVVGGASIPLIVKYSNDKRCSSRISDPHCGRDVPHHDTLVAKRLLLGANSPSIARRGTVICDPYETSVRGAEQPRSRPW
jgi:predicted NBD/HSP70 family sugar kinase